MLSHSLKPLLCGWIGLLLSLSLCRPVCAAAPTPTPGAGNGLWGAYYNDVNFNQYSYSELDPQVNLNLASGSPPGLDPDYFSIQWTGYLQAQYSETYTIYIRDDDGARVYINGILLIDHWLPPHSPTEVSATIALTAGQQVPITVEMYENTGNSVAQLSWSSASTPKQLVPQSQLYSSALPAPSPPRP